MITPHNYVGRSAGFTLAEMLIVLAILAITTTIAVQSLVPVASQARYSATEQTLTTIKNAIIGSPTGAANPGVTSGFVADMGRLPMTLAELFLNPSNLSTPQTFSAVQDATLNASTVTVISGWNGPYITTPVGQTAATAIVDGWGQSIIGPHRFATTDWTVWSSGPNGVDDTTAGGLTSISGDDIPLVIYPTDYQAASITVTTSEISGGALAPPTLATGEYVELYLYTINGGNVTNDMTVVNVQYDGLLGPTQGNVLFIQPTATVKTTSSSYTFNLYGSQANSLSTQQASPAFNFTFSPAASSPALPLTLNAGMIVLQAAHYTSAGAIKYRSVPIVASLTPRVTLNPTLVLQ